ncbi:hypothetical protein HK099_003002, partial [Clydaea vesicula]
ISDICNDDLLKIQNAKVKLFTILSQNLKTKRNNKLLLELIKSSVKNNVFNQNIFSLFHRLLKHFSGTKELEEIRFITLLTLDKNWLETCLAICSKDGLTSQNSHLIYFLIVAFDLTKCFFTIKNNFLNEPDVECKVVKKNFSVFLNAFQEFVNEIKVNLSLVSLEYKIIIVVTNRYFFMNR